jgi:hypothetical protein
MHQSMHLTHHICGMSLAWPCISKALRAPPVLESGPTCFRSCAVGDGACGDADRLRGWTSMSSRCRPQQANGTRAATARNLLAASCGLFEKPTSPGAGAQPMRVVGSAPRRPAASARIQPALCGSTLSNPESARPNASSRNSLKLAIQITHAAGKLGTSLFAGSPGATNSCGTSAPPSSTLLHHGRQSQRF